MKENLLPAVLTLGTLLFFSAGCVMSYGTLALDMDSTEPYRLSCSGERNECAEEIRSVLAAGNFELTGNGGAGSTLRATKTLPDDERMFLSGRSARVTGAEVPVRNGTLNFALTDADTAIAVTMEGLLTLHPEEREQGASGPPDTTTAFRGHPMMVRYGLDLHETDQISVLEPSSGRLKSERVQSR
jgi:hypothetical protein